MKLESKVSLFVLVSAIALSIFGSIPRGQSYLVPQRSSKSIDELFSSPNSLGSIAVGVAEGTRTPDGGKTQYWKSHIDPGNKRRNQGTFSYQHPASSPEEADKKQIAKIKPFLERTQKEAIASGVTLSEFELVVLADAFTQSEAAAYDWLGNLKKCQSQGKSGTGAVLCARVESFKHPDGRLDAPGLGNSLARVEADQRRRLEAIASVISPQSVIIHPVPGTQFTSGFYTCKTQEDCRKHPVWGTKEAHWGADFAGPLGMPVLAASSGIVEIGETKCEAIAQEEQQQRCGAGHGNHLTISGQPYSTFYAHLKSILVTHGSTVEQGQVIGELGSSGASTGPHLHFEVRKDGVPIDPIHFLAVDTSTEIYGRAN